MSSPFVGQIQLFPFNFAPKGWAFCLGQLLPISQNTALFSLLGTQYGGDGKSNFALPNLADQIAVGQGQGPGTSLYFIGEASGSATVTLQTADIPGHTHSMPASTGSGRLATPTASSVLGATGRGIPKPYATTTDSLMAAASGGVAGADIGHNNMMPFLALSYCIALQGVYPPRQ